MATPQDFRAVYLHVASPLRLDRPGSIQYQGLLTEWLLAGSPTPIDVYLIVRASQVRDDPEDDLASEDATALD